MPVEGEVIMAGDCQYYALKKLTNPAQLMQTAKHNLREYLAELGAGSHIDAGKIQNNLVLAGAATARGVVDMHRETLQAIEISKLRKDAVLAVECVISLPASTAIELEPFFRECLQWLREYYDCPVLSAVVHADEGAPHCHYLIMPLINGKMNGSDLVGNRAKLRQVQTDFHKAIGDKYGLKHNGGLKLSKRLREAAAKRVLQVLCDDPLALSLPNVRLTLCDLIAGNPAPICDALGLELETKQPQSLVALMTRPVSDS
ncbi:plasmid recombination protein [Deefgea tanakiae]|uniref:Plasmid recombination protein n=1 Tax=Deefgea tanakiae TaxID=2865840 RepID=A0ABX8ZBD2_9NEIS|nr:plasmid recombination protein [Deefgea tanakiae]QZA78184.1 plasmid recombination protein [Deefgea tanakiae]